jgi:hypothetical protein
MWLVNKLLAMLFAFSTLCSCSAIVRETGIVDPHEEKHFGFGYGKYYLNSDWPSADLHSACDDRYMVTIGPFFVIPLPVIPNPLWPFNYYRYKKRPADMTLTIWAKAKEHNWSDAHVEVIVDGQPVPVQSIKDESSEWVIKQQLYYHFGITCKELENSEIIVQISGIPKPIESHLKYSYRWQIFTDGI